MFTHAVLPAVRNRFKYPRSIRDLLPRFLLTRLSPAFPRALTAPPDSRETTRFTAPVFREATITAPLPRCECMQPDVPYTHLFCARREGLQDRMTHLHTARSDCVLNKRRKTDRLIYTSRFVRVIYSSCILPRPGTVIILVSFYSFFFDFSFSCLGCSKSVFFWVPQFRDDFSQPFVFLVEKINFWSRLGEERGGREEYPFVASSSFLFFLFFFFLLNFSFSFSFFFSLFCFFFSFFPISLFQKKNVFSFFFFFSFFSFFQ